MDKYTLMASKCKQLQEEWEPQVGDKIKFEGEEYYLTGYEKSCSKFFLVNSKQPNISNWPSCDVGIGENIIIHYHKKELIYKPSLEDLIGMLGKISWRLRKVEVDVNRYSYEAWTWEMPKDGFWAGTHKKALIKLVAYERWGLQWDEEKEDWV